MSLIALVVDDEPLAREGLCELLASDPEITAIYEARNGKQALEMIYGVKPDLVFLDVQMPEMDGLEVTRTVGAEHMPAVVFVTAHDQYAIQAFETNALDYLLKPVTEERFRKALERAKTRKQAALATDQGRHILSLLESMVAPPRTLNRLAVRTAGKTIFVNVDQIDWIEAAENYVQLHVGRVEHLLHVTLTTLEKSLDPERFLRVHRSTIVNIRRIKELRALTHGEYVVTLSSGARIQSGRLYSERLKALAENPF